MGVLDVSVRFEGLKRGPTGNVQGKVELLITGTVAGKDYKIPVDARNFDFPRDGEQAIYDQDFGVKVLAIEFSVKVTAKIYEKPSGQCCISGRVEGKSPISLGKDLDPNCQPIPA